MFKIGDEICFDRCQPKELCDKCRECYSKNGFGVIKEVFLADHKTPGHYHYYVFINNGEYYKNVDTCCAYSPWKKNHVKRMKNV